ncbi:MAG: L-threonylcarbamoyladenylate synthase [Deltaproteobacteria bacterium]|nr:L-threonylcarbamoyladenylate synthase [Deltaproteobacteria bacterium]
MLEIDRDRPNHRRIAQAVELLREGKLVAYPTDVNYGIGCDLHSKRAVERLRGLRGLDAKKRLTFLCEDLSQASRYARIDDVAFKLMRRLTPGPYTFILEATREVPKVVATKQKSVGVRIVESAAVLAMVQQLGHPVLNTTAADVDGAPLGDPRLLRDELGHGIDLILDCGLNLLESTTVVDLQGEQPEVIRVGAGPVEDL